MEQTNTVTLVIEYWNKDKTLGEIARLLNITRASASGIVNRAKAKGLITRIVEKPKRGLKNKRPAPRAPQARAVYAKKAREEKIELPAEFKIPEPVEELSPIEQARGKTLLELKARDCRWIKPNGRYCATRGRSSMQPWCPVHFSIVYEKGTSMRDRRKKSAPER